MATIKDLVTKMNQKKILVLFFLVLIVVSRISTIILIPPANAPDENAHLYIVNNLSHGNFVSVEDELKNSKYPYSLYNPLPYLPSILSLKIANFFNPKILTLRNTSPTSYEEYSIENVWAARSGQMVWTLLFFIVLWKLLEQILLILNITDPNKTTTILALPYLFIISLPQLLFVQSYVNLDSMGVFASFYHIWSILSGSPIHFAISLFLLLNSKLNFICILPLSFLYLIYLYKHKKLNHTWLKPIGISLVLSLWWTVILPVFQRMGLKSILGFKLLGELYKNEPFILSNPSLIHFVQMTFLSSYGVFGWMNQYMPIFYYLSFCLLLGTGIVTFVFYIRKFKKDRLIFIGLQSIIISNISLHFLSGMINSYQPQGRYLLPSVIIVYTCGLIYISIRITKLKINLSKLKFLISILFLGYAMSELTLTIQKASEDPFLMAYQYSPSLIKQELSHEKTKELLTGDEIIQTFMLTGPISKIYVRVTSFYRSNTNSTIISLSNCIGTIFQTNKISFNKLNGLADIKVIDFDKSTILPAMNYCLSLKVESGEIDNSIALLKSFKNTTHLGKLTLNGEPLGGDLVIKVY